MIRRIDKYTIEMDGKRVTATPMQEQRLRDMSPEERERFLKIMTGGSR